MIQIAVGLIVLSFFVPSFVELNKLRNKGYSKLAEVLESLIMILAIICQWSWYFTFFYIIINLFR
jgi:hypothetical protein